MKIKLYMLNPSTNLFDLDKYGMKEEDWKKLNNKEKRQFLSKHVLPEWVDFEFEDC